MSDAKDHNHDHEHELDGESSEQPAGGGGAPEPEPERADHEQCHETVDPETRDAKLAAAKHRCQACGREGPLAGGLATLEIHHIERSPEGMDEHDPENLTVLCASCHSWLHQRATKEDAPVRLSEADLAELLPHDIEMLQLLAEEGPMTTGEIAAALSVELSVMAVRERLWVLMGLDTFVEGRDQQVVDQDADTGEWGLVGQIETSMRGRIPSDPQLLVRRMTDERVRQALEQGCDRGMIASVLGVTERTTYHMQKRAHAYDIPLDALSGPSRTAPTG